VYQRSYSQVRHISPKMSDKFESTLSKSNYLVGHFGLGVQFFDYEVLLCIERLLCPSVTNIDLGATFPGANMVQGKNTLGYLRTRTFYTHIQYTPSVSTIKLSGPTYSSQNIRQMSDKFESQHSLSPTIWSDVRVDIKRFFIH
jgi:hypothetical protein